MLQTLARMRKGGGQGQWADQAENEGDKKKGTSLASAKRTAGKGDDDREKAAHLLDNNNSRVGNSRQQKPVEDGTKDCCHLSERNATRTSPAQQPMAECSRRRLGQLGSIQTSSSSKDSQRTAASDEGVDLGPRKSSSSLEQSILAAGRRTPAKFELNAFGAFPGAPHSPATSPGASSTNSQRSFHFQLVSNLRKSGVNLVRNIPANIRRSSLAMIRAMGNRETANGGEMPSAEGISPEREEQQLAGDNGGEGWANRREMLLPNEGIKQHLTGGSAARRAMRKRISAAKLALRKISRISTHSAGTTGTLASTSSAHSSPKTPVSVYVPCGGNSSPLEKTAEYHQIGHHPLRKCVSQRLMEADQQREEEEDENMSGRKREGGKGSLRLKGGREQPKKKRSWARTFGGGGGGKREDSGGDRETERRTKGTAGKKPLGPSLSWDPQQQRSRSTSAEDGHNSRNRIHSDGSTKRLPPPGPDYWPFGSGGAQQRPTGADESQQEQNGEGQGRAREQGHQQQERHYEKWRPSAGGWKRRKKSSSAMKAAGGLSHSLGALFGPDESERSALEMSCLHCALLAEYRTTNLRAEIESAVKRLAARLSSGGSPARTRRTLALAESFREREKAAKPPRCAAEEETERQMEQLRRQMGTPDIVVSSCNSAESADEGFWTNPSPTQNGQQFGTDSGRAADGPQQQCPSADGRSPLPPSLKDQTGAGGRKTKSSPDPANPVGSASCTGGGRHQQYASGAMGTMDTLKPPGFPFGLPCSSTPSSSCSHDFGTELSSPPRSNSVDLSLLRRDIELWSVSSLSSGDAGCGNGPSGCESRMEGMAGLSTPGSDSIRTVRSRSYDPSSPDQMLRRPSRIEHLSEIFRKALAKSPVVKRAAAMQEQEQRRVSKHRTSRYWLEEQLNPGEHIWLPSSSSSSSHSSASVDNECYLGEKDCEKLGEKRRCAACHIVAHTACFPLLAKMNLGCKSTFRDCQASNSSRSKSQREWDSLNKHHWVHRWRLEGRCHHCRKSFQQKMFREKEVIAITCSWCKRSYHNKRSCFSLARFDDHCDMGVLRELILPPAWLLRLSNQRRQRQQQHRSNSGSRNNNGTACGGQQTGAGMTKRSRRKYRPFLVKLPLEQQQPQQNRQQLPPCPPVPNGLCQSPVQPLLVFVNPKSGGNKGAKALNTLCWLLNPRQVFDINAMKGPKYGLEMFRKVAGQMRILVCGGDGTVGWVLSTLDQLSWPIYPPIALLPLGTGNDLSRSMGWGGTFSDEPLVEVLAAITTETSVTHLDRWQLDVLQLPSIAIDESPAAASPTRITTAVAQLAPVEMAASDPGEGQQPSEPFQSTLPLSVMNNYFSIGADAHVALQFHHSRSANPQMLNSRLKNRIAYGGLGTIDLFKRAWKDLSEFITVECDGVDITPKIREFKFHCVLFHNIGFYAGGTVPWGQGGEGVQESLGEVFSRPSPCDGKIEVLGFTTATLAALQMGGRGERIAQCSKVRIETSKPIPMQVDGEPCLLGPSLIHLSFHNKVPMLRREKFPRLSGSAPANNIVSMNANRRKSSNNSSGGGATSTGTVSAGAAFSVAQIHKSSWASLTADGGGTTANNLCPPNSQQQNGGILQSNAAPSPPSTLVQCVPVVVVGRHDYDTYRDTADRLKDTGFELGTLNLEAEMELFQVRQLVQQMMADNELLPYEPSRDWRFLDYVSNSEEGTFRISRHQELSRTVADVCVLDEGAGLLILDDAFPSMTVRSAAIGHELVFSPAAAKALSAAEQNLLMRRRISETLRIVLSSTESQETYL